MDNQKQKEIVEQGWYCNLSSWGPGSFVPDNYVWLTAPTKIGLEGKYWSSPGGCSTCAKSCEHGSVEHIKLSKNP